MAEKKKKLKKEGKDTRIDEDDPEKYDPFLPKALMLNVIIAFKTFSLRLQKRLLPYFFLTSSDIAKLFR